MKKPLIYLVAVLSGVSLLQGCSTSKPMVEPFMAPMESDYALQKNWQVKLATLPNRDVEGLFFAESSEHLFIASETGHLAALKKDNQSRWVDQVTWQVKFDSPIVSGPTRDGDRILVGTSKGQMIAVAADTGEYLWQKQLSSEVMSRAIVAEGKIFTRTVDGKLYALNANSGEEIWVVEHQMPSLSLRGSPAVVYENGVLYVGWESGSVQALTVQSGERLWETRVAVPRGRTDLERMVDVQASLVLNGDRLYALGYHGKLASIDPRTGNFFFVKEVSGYRDFVVDNSGLYVVDENDVLYGFDKQSGTQFWKQESFKNRLVGDLSLSGDDILAVDAWGYLHWVSKVQGVEIGRVKHSNEYGDGNRILRVFSQAEKTYLLDDEGIITSYNVKPSNLKQFRIEHNEQSEMKAEVTNTEDGEAAKKSDDQAWWDFKLSDIWPF